MTEVLDVIVGKTIWLEYYDPNVVFEHVFTPQYCKVLERFISIHGDKDWYLIELEAPFAYEGTEYTHLMIRSRWVGCPIGGKEATAVFIVLVPNANSVARPLEMDRSHYIAWGFAANDPGDIKR